MSVELISLVLNHSRSEGTDKVVLLGIANHAGDGGSWPSISTLTRYTSKSRRTVERSIKNLVEMGELRVHVKQGGTLRTKDEFRTNMYEILTVPRFDADGNPLDPPDTHVGAPPTPTSGL